MALRGNIVANYAGQGWSALASVAFVPVYIRLLGIESYALIGIYTMLQAWLALLDLGMSPALSREMARFLGGSLSAMAAKELLRSVELVCAGLMLLITLLLATSAPWIATHWLVSSLPPEQIIQALRLCGVVVACRFMETMYRSALYGLDRQIWFNGFNVGITTARFGGAALVLALIAPTIPAFFLWQLAVSLVSVTMLRLKTHQSLPEIAARRFSLTALQQIGSFASGLIVINLTALVLTQADKLVISRTLQLSQLGYYSLAYTISNLVAAAVGPVAQAFYPVFSRQHARDDQAALHLSYSLGAQVVSVAAVTIASVLILFPSDLIRVWSGDAVLAARTAPVVMLLTVGGLANALLQIPYFTLLAVGRVRPPLILNVVAAGFFLIMLLLLVPRHGLQGAATAWLMVNAAMLLAGALTWSRWLPVKLAAWMIRDVGAPVLAGIAAAALVRAMLPDGHERTGTWLGLATAGAAALLTSAATTKGFRAVARRRWRTAAGVVLNHGND